MILFRKRTIRLVPFYLLYMAAVLAASSLYELYAAESGEIVAQVFGDRVYCYLLVPPFIWKISTIDGKNKMLSTMPFISAYLLLLIDEQVIQSVTNRNGITIRLIFSWAFQPLGLVLLPVFLAITTLLLLQLNRTYDIF